MVTIAVDAMGGDHAPKSEVEGALAAAAAHNVKVLLVGHEAEVLRELDKHSNWKSLPIELVHASERITMEDTAAKAVRNKRDSSIRVASRLVREGQADGVVSAGHTGAVMASVKMVQGMIPGVERPAVASTLPTLKGTPAIVLDVGANVDSTPRMLAQFAVMGEIYSRVILHIPKPRVGLLSIGEEEHKGNDLTRAATPLLKSLPIHYIGNVEGRDVFTGSVDVIVCDGFTGNVVLKVSEGLADVFKHMLQDSIKATLTRRIGYFIARAAFADLKRRTDYSEYGGAPLLGVKGVCIITHGSANTSAIKNSIRVAAEFASAKINTRIETELSRWSSSQVAVKAE